MLTKEREKELAAQAARTFGTRLGMARAQKFADQDAAGAALGLRKRRWGGYERATREPPLWVLRELPQLLHRPLSWFFDLPDERGLGDKESQIVSLLRQIKDPIVREGAADGVIRLLEAQAEMDQSLRERELQSAPQ